MQIPQEATAKAKQWVEELGGELGTDDPHRAWSYLRAVLHALRDRLGIDEAVQLGAQLPLVIRGLYYEGWHPAHKPDKSIKTREDFLERIEQNLGGLPGDTNAIARAVLGVLDRHLTFGESAAVRHVLPHDLKTYWREA